MTITDSQIERRAAELGRDAARRQLEAEAAQRAQQQREAAQQRDEQMRVEQSRALAQMTQLKPGYQRRAELIGQLAPVLSELMQLDAELQASAARVCESMLTPWRESGRDERAEIPRLRERAGLPVWHNTVTRAGDDRGSRLAQALGQMVASGQVGLTHDGKLVVSIGGQSAIYN